MPSVAIAASSSGQNTLVAAVTSPGNKKIRVHAVALTSAGTVNVKFRTGAATDISGLFYEVANSGFVLPYSEKPWFETVAGEALTANLSAAVAVGGVLIYELG